MFELYIGGDERGVSEVVGFVLVFSLMIATIAIVYTSGFAGLQDTRDTERVNNAERAFDVMADNFQKLARNEAPNRATEIKLAGAELSVRGGQRSSVTTTETNAISSRPVYFSPGADTDIVYEHGAVIRDQSDGALMLREPDFVFTQERTVIRYIEIRGGSQSVGGETTVLVRGQVSERELMVTDSDHTDVTFELNTTEGRAGVWMEYFEDELEGLGSTCDRTDHTDGTSTVSCTFESDLVHVARTRIEVSVVT